MITLRVIAFNDTPADGTLQAHFDELGGSIGRAVTNQLVLPDPERMVSRVAAQVVYRNGAYAIIDRGSNPIMLNGSPLSSGREAALNAGDRVCICGYELSVEIGGGSSAAQDPFSAFLGPGAGAAKRGDPGVFDPLAKPSARPVRATPPADSGSGGIPADWDPFAPHAAREAKAGAPPARPRDALGLDLDVAAPGPLVPDFGPAASADSSLDQLFGLGPSHGADPLAQSMLDAPMAQPNMAADADPMRSLNSAPRASAPTEADQLSDLNRPFIPPTTFKAVVGPRPLPPLSGAVMSWDDRNAPGQTSIRAKMAQTPPAPTPTPSQRTVPLAAEPASQQVTVPQPQDRAALLDAFRRGLNAPTVELPALTPEVMEVVGQLLHEAVRGTVDLLRARATVKHEMRADVTYIVARRNNPLKFSPNAEAALQHMLAPPARGYLPAVPAMREAYDDLRAHHVAFIAGMQSALDAALQRFDPAALESQLGDRSLLHSLLPASRSAKLWDMFIEHYARICKDATDDFHALFGSAFLAAYEEHVKRLRDREPEA